MKKAKLPPYMLEIMEQLRDNIEGQPGKKAFYKWTWDVLDIIYMELSRKYNLQWKEWRDGNDGIRTFTLNKRAFGKTSLKFALRMEKKSEDKVGLCLICGLTQGNGIPDYHQPITDSYISRNTRNFDEMLEATFQHRGRALGLKTEPITGGWNRLPDDYRNEGKTAESCCSTIEEIFEQLQPGPRQVLKKKKEYDESEAIADDTI